jgi:serine/threonine protein kinase/formylglycine-generating enzyme required for sulfatase activity
MDAPKKGRSDSPASPLSSTDGLSMLAGRDPSAPVPPAASSLPPGLADHPDYRIVRELGQGGMGVVYLAENTLMGRKEVLKVVGSHLVNRRGVLDRFVGEIRSAARLHHANVVTAYAVIRLGETLVLTMEYVDGLDLARLVKARGPLPVASACNYLHQAALGLQHAHESGMVHRDIKPGNLMLSSQGGRALIKLLDFGLAKVIREGPTDGALTHEGQMLGTPDYIAPEQIADARRADIRADIYSLGCTLYYLLTAGPPFKGTNLYDILQAHHSMDALPLNLARPEVPIEVAAIVAKMMAKEPDRRFQEPKQVAQALLPFFKKGSPESVRSKLEISQAGQANIRWPAATPTRAAMDSRRSAASDEEMAKPTLEWSEIRDDVPPLLRRSWAVQPPKPAPIPWFRSIHPVGTGVACALLTIAIGLWAGGLIRVRTADGTLIVQVNEPNPDLYVDGEKVSIAWQNGGVKAEVGVKPGTRMVELKKDGFRVFGQEVTLEDHGRTVLVARLEPSESTTPKPVVPAAAVPVVPGPAVDAAHGETGKRQLAREPAENTARELEKSHEPLPADEVTPSRTAAGSVVSAKEGSRAGEERDDNALKLKLCWCPAGTMRGFWMGKYEVTQSEWAGLMGSMPSHRLEKGKGDRHPIYYVSQGDATEFCRKLTDLERNAGRYRLPTEVQWEFACRAGTTTATSFGDKLSSRQANFNGDWPHNGAARGPNLGKSVKVGSYRPNAWGIYDMHGNVKEFTTTPGHVRGGSWYDSGRNCCSEIFIPDPPNACESVGFRVARVALEEE